MLIILPFFFFFYSSVNHRDLHSFPTRRSSDLSRLRRRRKPLRSQPLGSRLLSTPAELHPGGREARHRGGDGDRKSTRLNSSHVEISYAVFCLKKKKSSFNKFS